MMIIRVVKLKNNAEHNASPKLHSAVRRRRIVWLLIMVFFLVWSCFQILTQQFRLWERHKVLETKQNEIKKIELENRKLKETLSKTNDEEYLLEESRKRGYGLKGDQIYQPKD